MFWTLIESPSLEVVEREYDFYRIISNYINGGAGKRRLLGEDVSRLFGKEKRERKRVEMLENEYQEKSPPTPPMSPPLLLQQRPRSISPNTPPSPDDPFDPLSAPILLPPHPHPISLTSSPSPSSSESLFSAVRFERMPVEDLDLVSANPKVPPDLINEALRAQVKRNQGKDVSGHMFIRRRVAKRRGKELRGGVLAGRGGDIGKGVVWFLGGIYGEPWMNPCRVGFCF